MSNDNSIKPGNEDEEANPVDHTITPSSAEDEEQSEANELERKIAEIERKVADGN
ncbi:hypothetical protein [Pseudomonas akapageensis]|uniref:hypothetical protein n=1 Tax=Pseudomonas akapageensis TaxID=2609961 RepID=UPI00140D8CE5|nr:hypothetical protein [Pseudomonas akapageensis]